MEVAIKWKDINPNIVDPVRNSTRDYLKFLNSNVFNEEARHFLKYGYYTDAPKGSKDYDLYWDIQEDRCINGYEVGGVRIPGRFYFFLNFGLMKITDERTKKKHVSFPRFIDHQYYLSHEIEECFTEGPHLGKDKFGLCILKSRRKGITYTNANQVLVYNYNFIPASTNLLAAYEKDHYKVTIDAMWFTINHLNKNTDWAKRRLINQREHIKAGFKYTDDNGMEIEDGFLSEIHALSFKDNPFKSIGESLYSASFEEAGKFEGLLTALTIAEPTWRDGDVMTGTPMVWGTGGSMESGTVDLAEMFNNPAPYGFKAYDNIYEDNAVGQCGYFIDDMWYYPGKFTKKIIFKGVEKMTAIDMVDDQGNSIRDIAEESLDSKRAEKKKGSAAAYNTFVSQQPKKPSEALLRLTGNVFDAVRAQAVLGYIETHRTEMISSIWVGKFGLEPNTGIIKFMNDDKLVPLRNFPYKDNHNKPGAVEIYEHPVKDNNGLVYSGRYIAGIDSYDKDFSTTTSFGSLLILDTWNDRIVCHYKGRPLAKEFHEQCRLALLYYSALANYERTNMTIYEHFFNSNSLYLLADEPEILTQRGISKSVGIGNNKKGTPGHEAAQALGIELGIGYLSEKTDDTEKNERTKLDEIRSMGLLKEFIYWNENGNFDDVSAFSMLMILRADKKKTIRKLVERISERSEQAKEFIMRNSTNKYRQSVAYKFNSEIKRN